MSINVEIKILKVYIVNLSVTRWCMFHILVIDDEPALLELPRIYLEQFGDLEVEPTSSPLQGLDMLSKASYDAIVADYRMPEMDGIALLKEVRRRGITIPFIVFSGYGREEVVIEALNCGADFYLQKNGNPSAQFAELRNMILQAVRRGQAEAEAQRAGDLYRSTFEHTGSATIIIEEDTTIALANSEFEHLTGYSREEMEGKMSWTVFVAAGDIERLKNYHRQRRIDPGSAPRIYEFRLIDRHGRQKDLHMTIGCIPGTDRTVASMLDISNRKRFEEELGAAHEELSAAHEELTAAFEEVKASEESLAAQCRIMEDYQANLRGMTRPITFDLKPASPENAEQAPGKLNTEVQLLAIGDIYILGLPSEVLVEIGFAIKEKAGLEKLFVVSIANDACGYICHKEAYEQGGYESTSATRLAPGAGEHLIEEALALIASMKKE